jgi:hypothetical protein
MTEIKMVEPGCKNDLCFRGICSHCGAKFEAEVDLMQSYRPDQNCTWCNGIRTVNMLPARKEELLLG